MVLNPIESKRQELTNLVSERLHTLIPNYRSYLPFINKRLFEDMALSSNSGKDLISIMRTGNEKYNFMYLPGLNDIKPDLKLKRLSLVLSYFGVQKEDSVIHKIREMYSEFIYPSTIDYMPKQK